MATICVRKDAGVRKVKWLEGHRMVAEQGYSYCPRKIWREQVRDRKVRAESGGKRVQKG